MKILSNKLYNFGIKSDLIRDHTKSYDFFYVIPFVGRIMLFANRGHLYGRVTPSSVPKNSFSGRIKCCSNLVSFITTGYNLTHF